MQLRNKHFSVIFVIIVNKEDLQRQLKIFNMDFRCGHGEESPLSQSIKKSARILTMSSSLKTQSMILEQLQTKHVN